MGGVSGRPFEVWSWAKAVAVIMNEAKKTKKAIRRVIKCSPLPRTVLPDEG
jgi:hypothetical protein